MFRSNVALMVDAFGGTEQLAPVTNRRSTYTDKKTIQKQSKDPPQRSKRSCNNNSSSNDIPLRFSTTTFPPGCPSVNEEVHERVRGGGGAKRQRPLFLIFSALGSQYVYSKKRREEFEKKKCCCLEFAQQSVTKQENGNTRSASRPGWRTENIYFFLITARAVKVVKIRECVNHLTRSYFLVTRKKKKKKKKKLYRIPIDFEKEKKRLESQIEEEEITTGGHMDAEPKGFPSARRIPFSVVDV
uniref:Uncharacterized protein n=1 Tax=Daphnia galeata TaxID=27404 RepID=A0A8J2S2D4_9CRUS|nr:unnamed protein product [Daphnia galeata]